MLYGKGISITGSMPLGAVDLVPSPSSTAPSVMFDQTTYGMSAGSGPLSGHVESTDTSALSSYVRGTADWTAPSRGLQWCVSSIWETGINRLLDPTFDPLVSADTRRLAMSMEMMNAILETRAAELGKDPTEVTVVVAGPGANPVEVLAWLQLGARVIAVEPDDDARSILEELRSELREFAEQFDGTYCSVHRDRSRLKILKKFSGKGDIVMWVHPRENPTLMSAKDFAQYSDAGGVIIVQTDFEYIAEDLISDGRFEVLLKSNRVELNKYVMPSMQIGNVPCWLVIARQKDE